MEPTRKEKKRTPRNMLRRDVLKDIKRTGYSWRELEKKTQNSRLWKTVVIDLCSRRGEG